MSENLGPLNIANGPTQEVINEWKSKYGDIYVATFSPEDKYVYRPMMRLEYKQIVGLAKDTDGKSFAEEKVFDKCVLWPKIDTTKMSLLKAGTISTLVDLIMAVSNFGLTEEPVKL